MDRIDRFAQDVNNYLNSEYPENYSFECKVNKKPDSFNILRSDSVSLICKVNGEHVRTLEPNELIDAYEHWLNEFNSLSGLNSHWQIELINALEGK